MRFESLLGLKAGLDPLQTGRALLFFVFGAGFEYRSVLGVDRGFQGDVRKSSGHTKTTVMTTYTDDSSFCHIAWVFEILWELRDVDYQY